MRLSTTNAVSFGQPLAARANPLLRAAILSALLSASGCGKHQTESSAAPSTPRATDTRIAEGGVASRNPSSAPTSDAEHGGAEHGRALVERYQCNRCHEGTAQAAVPREQHCVNCHRDILADRFPAAADKLSRWKGHVNTVRSVPSLIGVGTRLKASFIAEFLLSPYDLRPELEPTMPRLALSPSEARDIAAYFVSLGPKPTPPSPAPLVEQAGSGTPSDPSPARRDSDGDAQNGRALLSTRGCGNCHHLSRAPLPVTPAPGAAQRSDAVLLAPDLGHVRERWESVELVAWLRDPSSLKPDTLMPTTGFSQAEARDVATYLLRADLPEAPAGAKFLRLPTLDRPVTYAEVDEKVLRITCRHCHANPDIALGDGGPGNTGGFGFRARGIDLSSYGGVLSGYLDEAGQRRSLFEKSASGEPRLLAALLARHDEEAGHAQSDVRGMPLGLPAVSAAQIQLVESWIAQGRPR
ncbi:MAG TPA: cytochrome C oxidase Cbb3 [Polyangiaceae bacterium]|nr:cytochrome C oxidase Cbb3 [Polyangiaceae bacterium]